MTNIQFIQTGSNAIIAVVGSKSFTIAKDHPRISQIQEALVNDDTDLFLRNADVSEAIKDFAHGEVTVENGVVKYAGTSIHNSMTDRILELMKEDLPFLPMILFLGRLYGNEAKKFPGNPSGRAVKELYQFLQLRGMPNTEDGYFYAYKRTRDDWTDNWTGKISSKPGAKVPPMKRNMVDDNYGVACSEGYHVGSLEFVRGFTMNSGPQHGHIVIVKVNPGDVVSVPHKGVEKMRCCWYQPMAEHIDNEERIGHGLVDSPIYSGTSVTPVLSTWSSKSSGRSDNDALSEQPLGGKHITDC